MIVRHSEAKVNREEKKSIEGSARQKRYSLKEKAEYIEYMLYREESEVKSNVTWYGERNGVTRATLYKLRKQFIEAFAKERAWKKAEEQTDRWGKESQKAHEEELENLRAALDEARKGRAPEKNRIVRTILQSAVGPMSTREIRDLVWTAFGIKISKSKVKEIIAEYSVKARQILENLGLEELVKYLAIDEIFCGREPILTGVDLVSFAWVICKKAKNRDHKTWHEILDLFPCLRLVTSDRAKGILKAVSLCKDVCHQFDLFHFKRDAQRQLTRLENKAYREIETEYKYQAKLGKSEDRAQWEKKYLKQREESLKAIVAFDRAEKALSLIFEALEIFDKDGNLQDVQQNLKNLERGARMLQNASSDKNIHKISQQVLEPRFMLYLIDFRHRLFSILLRWKQGCPTMPRNKVLQIIARHWYWANQKDIHVSKKQNENHEQWSMKKQSARLVLERTQLATEFEMRQLQMTLDNFDLVVDQLNNALNHAFRSSSLVESLNSHVRVCQQVKKGFHQDFLYLVALCWNMRPFENGKRKGKSPFQILGIQGEKEDWLDFLLSN